MSVHLTAAAWDAPVSPTDKLVLLALADQTTDEGLCLATEASLMLRTGLCVRAVRMSLGRLEEGGHLTRQPRPGKSTFYLLHPVSTPARDAGVPRHQMPVTPAPNAGVPRHQMPGSAGPLYREKEEERDARAARAPIPQSARKDERGTRLSSSWEPSSDLLAWMESSAPDLSPVDVVAAFRDYWTAQPGQRGRKADWDATFRNWVRKTVEWKRPAGRGRDEPLRDARRLFAGAK